MRVKITLHCRLRPSVAGVAGKAVIAQLTRRAVPSYLRLPMSICQSGAS
jgi:hypothetical protein